MNDIYGDDEPQLPADLLAGKHRRVQGLNEKPLPVWKQGLLGGAVLVVLGGLGYAVYEAYFDVKPETTVEFYEGVKIASGPAQKDAQAAAAHFRASPAYAKAQQRALRDVQQGQDSGQ